MSISVYFIPDRIRRRSKKYEDYCVYINESDRLFERFVLNKKTYTKELIGVEKEKTLKEGHLCISKEDCIDSEFFKKC